MGSGASPASRFVRCRRGASAVANPNSGGSLGNLLTFPAFYSAELFVCLTELVDRYGGIG